MTDNQLGDSLIWDNDRHNDKSICMLSQHKAMGVGRPAIPQEPASAGEQCCDYSAL